MARERNMKVIAIVKGDHTLDSPPVDTVAAERQLEVIRQAQRSGGSVPVDLPWLTVRADHIVAAYIQEAPKAASVPLV